jgi:ABC-type multidrug transport system fused ATPase/permease subunit
MLKILDLLNAQQKNQLFIIILSIILISVVELTIFSLLQTIISYFLSSGNSFKINSELLNSFLYRFNNFNNILIIFFVFFLFRSIFSIFISFKRYSLVRDVNDNLSYEIYNVYLNQNYEFFINNKSSNLISNIIFEVEKFSYKVLDSFIYLMTEIVLIFAVLFFLFYNYFIQTLIFSLITILFFGSFYYYYRTIFIRLGKKKSIFDAEKLNDLQKSFFVIQNIKIDNLEKYFSSRFLANTRTSSYSHFFLSFISDIPKPIAELIVSIIVFSILFVFYFYFQMSKQEVFSMLGIFMVAMFRVLPSINRLIGAINQIKFFHSSIDIVYSELKIKQLKNELEDKNANNSKFNFSDSIDFKNVSFGYNIKNKKELILNKINFQIKKNDIVGIEGASGTGKTTLLNLICGLLHSTSGEILVDGKSIDLFRRGYQKKIGYVSQKTYLSDDSIINNVIFGKDKKYFDYNLFDESIEKSNLKSFIDSLPEGRNTFVGEMGSKLSGGQQQRIGIARALYKKPEILLLDEATSALDQNSEDEIVNTVNLLKGRVTIIIVSHRKTFLKCCAKLYKLENGILI